MIGATNSLIAIEITNEEAQQFLLFRKYYPQFVKMLSVKMFEVKGGSAIIDFNSSSEIDNIKIVNNYHFKKLSTVA